MRALTNLCLSLYGRSLTTPVALKAGRSGPYLVRQSSTISTSDTSPFIWNKNLSMEVVANMTKDPLPNFDDNEVDLSTLGTTKEKMEVDGMLINWDRAGTGDHVVLMLPGIIGCIQHDFAPLFKKMDKKKYTLVSWDPPGLEMFDVFHGYGRSRPPNRDFSGTFYRRDGHIVVKLMEKLGYDKFSLLGWSNGGITGGYIASDYPSRIRHLVTWGAHSFADERAVFFTKVMGNLDMWSSKMLKPALAMYGREYLLQMMQDWHKAVSDFHKAGLDVTFKEGLGKITCPTLVIHGREDPVLGLEHAEFFRDNVPNSTLWIMDDAKHNLHLKYTDEFLKVVTKFLDI